MGTFKYAAALLFLAVTSSSKTAFADWSWQPVANKMTDQRWAPSYSVLPDGQTGLIAGGYSFDRLRCVASADVYDETTNRFVRIASRLNVPRDFATATPLPDGTILIAGGFNDIFGSLNSAELFDPRNRSFTLLDQHMLTPRELHTATALNDGRVLIVGGLNLWHRRTQNTAEIYDSATSTFVHTAGAMSDDRFGHAACLLKDGRVLIVGGTSVLFGRNGFAHVLQTAEIYDPATGQFARTKSDMSVGRDRPTANLLPDGTVLIAGGQGPNGQSIDYSEIFDPQTETFSRVSASQITVRMAHCTGELPNHSLIITGGWSAPAKATTATVEEFDPSTSTFLSEPSLPFSSHDAAQIIFPDGRVLVAGGKTVAPNGAADGISAGATALP